MGIISLAKLAAIAVVLYVAWRGFKSIAKLSKTDNAKQDKHNASDDKIMEAETCEVCGVYVVKGNPPKNCNRQKCPYK